MEDKGGASAGLDGYLWKMSSTSFHTIMLHVMLLLASCRSGASPPTVLVVSLDTTRADAIGCYAEQLGLTAELESRPAPSTPNIDELAREGVRFAWALSNMPVTLGAHASLFSGLDSHGHRVVRNGFPIPKEIPLLQEQFREAGWDTLAAISSTVLDPGMGLERGFAVYDSEKGRGPMFVHRRSADDVKGAVTGLLEARRDRGTESSPLFLFVHFYDAHAPWISADPDALSKYSVGGYGGFVDGSLSSIQQLRRMWKNNRLRMVDSRQAWRFYLAELSTVDRVLGELLDDLRGRHLLDNGLVVILGDHGETLDDADVTPYSHGEDVDLRDIHVPLIFTGYGNMSLPRGTVVSKTVRLQDVGATIAALAGLDQAPGEGQRLDPLWKGQDIDIPPLLGEAGRPRDLEDTRNWNNLPFERTVVDDGLMLLRNPLWPSQDGLFAVAEGQPRIHDQGRAAHLRQLLAEWDAVAPSHRYPGSQRKMDEALRALGYLEDEPSTSASSQASENLKDVGLPESGPESTRPSSGMAGSGEGPGSKSWEPSNAR